MQKDYKNQGFYVLKNFFDKKTLFSIQLKIRKIFSLFYGSGSDFDIIDLYKKDFNLYLQCAKMCQNIPDLYKLYTSDFELKLQQLNLSFPVYNMRPVVHLSSKHTASHQFYWKANAHQDWYGMRGSLDGIVAWLPIFDIKKEHGFLEVIPKSHLQGLKKHVLSGPTYEICEELEENKFESIEIELGDVLIFSAFTIHRSGINLTDEIRFALSLRFDNLEEKTFKEKKYPQSFNYVRTDSSIDYNESYLKEIFYVK